MFLVNYMLEDSNIHRENLFTIYMPNNERKVQLPDQLVYLTK